MGKVLSFKQRVNKVKTGQTTSEFIVICQKKKKNNTRSLTRILQRQTSRLIRNLTIYWEELQLDNHICMEDRQEKARMKIEYKPFKLMKEQTTNY